MSRRDMYDRCDNLVAGLAAKAQRFRLHVLEMIYNAQTGHLGGAFSVAEILTCLFFHHLNIDPTRPDMANRDRLLFSKGHACAMLYVVMAEPSSS